MAAEDEEAKRFDLLLLNLQLAVLRAEPSFERLREQVKTIASLLEEKTTIPLVQAQRVLIEEVQTDDWWQDVTVPLLERLRRRLRDLIKFIEKQRRQPIYTNFEDVMGSELSIQLPGFSDGTDLEKFKAKVQAFLRARQEHITIHKLRMNRPLIATDLAELTRMLATSGIGSTVEIERAAHECAGLSIFVRTLMGLDREAAKLAFAQFLHGKTLTANQIEFVNLIIDHLTEHGVMDAAWLYESPFTDLTPHGPDGLFSSPQVDQLLAILDEVRATAVAA